MKTKIAVKVNGSFIFFEEEYGIYYAIDDGDENVSLFDTKLEAEQRWNESDKDNLPDYYDDEENEIEYVEVKLP